jgi:xanthine/CO dehydrogenase XdhC/CoxF family maturation factor
VARSVAGMADQPWRDEGDPHGHIVAVTDNPIARAIEALGSAVGWRVTVLDVAEPLRWLAGQPLMAEDALVVCDHDTPFALKMVRFGLDARIGYVAMMGSRRRAETVYAELSDVPAEDLDRLHVPAGLDIGGKSPGEIALSVVAEIVATAHGRPGGPMGMA